MTGIGLTIPLPGCTLAEHRDAVRAAADLGYGSVWSSEASQHDGFTPLVLTAAWQPDLELGTAVIPVHTRGAAVLAQSFASLAQATPAQTYAGIGASSPVVVKNWNGIDFDQPYQRVRDTLRFLKQAFTGQRVSAEYETFAVKSFRLDAVPALVPKVLLAVGGASMARLAGRDADGAVVNWVSPADVAQIATAVNAAAGDRRPEIIARIFVCPSTDAEAVRRACRPFLADYVTPPGYRAFHEWVGRGDRLRGVFAAWDDHDRPGAAAAITDDVIDEIVIHGSPQQCRDRVQAYLDAGLTGATLALLNIGMDSVTAMRRLGAIGDFH
jgi:probable F420-dependent oxidoreductase